MGPRRNDRATCEDRCSRVADDSIGAAGEINIVDNERVASGWSVATRAEGRHYAFWRIHELAVLDYNAANCLICWAVGHVYANATVVNGDGLEVPNPIPIHKYCGLAVVESQVSSRELLVPHEHAVITTVEG